MYFNDKEGIEICQNRFVASSIPLNARLSRARGIARTEPAIVRWPNVNIPMVIDLRPVFGAKPKASPTLVKRLLADI